jgi:Ni/Fe-hydrogenase subunit HybB-like protein
VPLFILKAAVAGLKIVHLPQIRLPSEFLSARPDGSSAQAAEKFKILCAFEHLHHLDRP